MFLFFSARDFRMLNVSDAFIHDRMDRRVLDFLMFATFERRVQKNRDMAGCIGINASGVHAFDVSRKSRL